MDEMLRMLKNMPKVYVYMTHGVSECHGFAIIEYGQLKRLFCIDEEEGIRNIGNPSEEEKRLGFCLPKDTDEMWEHWEDDTMTKINEEIIVELAIEQSGIDGSKYPYDDVLAGVFK